jgi:hypothetical protein
MFFHRFTVCLATLTTCSYVVIFECCKMTYKTYIYSSLDGKNTFIRFSEVLPAGLLASLPCSLSTFRKMVKKTVTKK